MCLKYLVIVMGGWKASKLARNAARQIINKTEDRWTAGTQSSRLHDGERGTRDEAEWEYVLQ